MPIQHHAQVEFIGGPIDGQMLHFSETLKPFVVVQTLARARRVSLFVQLFRMLCFYDHTEPPVLAIYELEGQRYRYVRSTLGTDATWAHQSVCQLVQDRPPFRACTTCVEKP
ncbi:hypothetical protein [Roseimaritima sediminicola]|uniref:hypothetical protein n=1 Tax=Roseimaritima sediminicola TaxID=2662066 RepID=UPI0012984AC9|nr:hypothetical protein [Roseimaritima sediminicola]